MNRTDNNPIKLTREEHALLVKVQVDPVRAFMSVARSIHHHRTLVRLDQKGLVRWPNYEIPKLTRKGLAQLEHPPEPDADPDP